MTDPLSTWKEGAAKEAILGFVDQTCRQGSAGVLPKGERVAVFDNDGTLWCEKPMPIQLDFILRRLAEMAEADPTLRGRQPWKAARDRDYGWLAGVVEEHYAGDDLNLRRLGAGVVAAFANITVDQFEEGAEAFLRETRHPTLNRGYLECAYSPMVELLEYLRANGFATYIASGGGRDFMRPVSEELYGIPREGLIGSAVALAYTPDDEGGVITRQVEADYLDDGPEKPVHIWTRTGRRPILAAGNSNGDIEMLDFAQHRDKASLRLLVLHDDPEREFVYTSGAEKALDRATMQRATVELAGLGANLPEDAIYPLAFVDAEGNALNGADCYTWHLAKEDMPPVRAFWSLTLYDEEGFQVANELDRFAIGDRDDLRFNADGSLDIYVQREQPAQGTSSWLPAPAGTFNLCARLYYPKHEALDGTWTPPAVVKTRRE